MLNDIFKALSDPTRREILKLLRSGELSAGDISGLFKLAKSTMSAHFTVLRHAGLIVQERRQQRIVYSLNISAAEEMAAAVLEFSGIKKIAKRNSHSKGVKL